MDLYQQVIPSNVFYVYTHVDPETNTLLYVGMGSKGRAWHCAHNSSRSREHSEHLDKLISKGYTPNDWVTIVAKALDKNDAQSIEGELIWNSEVFPLYNSKFDHSCVMNLTQLKIAKELRGGGLSYNKISNILDISTMTIYRALNGKTKNYS